MDARGFLTLLALACVFIVANWLIKRSLARERAMVEMYLALLAGEDRRIVQVALFYGESIDQIRARIASGQTIGTALGHTILIPKCPPYRPARQP